MTAKVTPGDKTRSTDRHTLILTFETVWGPCRLEYAPDPFSLIGITLPGTGQHVGLPTAVTDDIAHPSARRVAEALTAFFAGHRTPMIPEHWLCLDRLTPKERAVLEVVRRIPYGATRTYGQVAELAGFPRGARFAGNTLNKNPLPVIIPCHRVIRSDGTIGGFASGCQMKRKMIALEAADNKNKPGFA